MVSIILNWQSSIQQELYRLLDGQITDDTDAYSEEQMKADIQEKEAKAFRCTDRKEEKESKDIDVLFLQRFLLV